MHAALRASLPPAPPHSSSLCMHEACHCLLCLQACRLSLPICAVREDLLSALAVSDVAVVSGDTGCGKTTQVGPGGGALRVRYTFTCTGYPMRGACMHTADLEWGAQRGTLGTGVQIKS